MLSESTGRTQSLLFVFGALVVVGSISGAGTLFSDATSPSPQPINETSLEYEIHNAVNEKRVEAGLSPLTFDKDLQLIADNFSQTMAEDGFFAHRSPSGNTFRDRYEAAGYECNRKITDLRVSHGGENLAKTAYGVPVETSDGKVETYTTQSELADGIVEGWMESSSHRKNILSGNWAVEGIGVHITDDNTVYITQNFC